MSRPALAVIQRSTRSEATNIPLPSWFGSNRHQVLFVQVGGGARRWIGIGGFNFQPSELAKVTVPMMSAHYLADRSLPPRLLHLLVTFAIVGLPCCSHRSST